MSDAEIPAIPAAALETVESLRVLALTQERRIARLEDRATRNGDTSAALRAEIAEARAELRAIYDRLNAMSDTGSDNPLSWLNPFKWFEKASGENAASAVKVFQRLFTMGLIAAALYYASTVLDRILDAKAADARTPDTEITVEAPGLPAEVDAVGIEADSVYIDTPDE